MAQKSILATESMRERKACFITLITARKFTAGAEEKGHFQLSKDPSEHLLQISNVIITAFSDSRPFLPTLFL